MPIRHLWFVIVFVLVSAHFAFSQEPADIVLYNGKILTVDSNFRVAQAAAIRGNRIAAVGTNDEVLTLAGSNTTRIDLKGKTVTPGLINTHMHMESLGGYRREVSPTKSRKFPVNMRAVRTKDDLVKQISDIIAAFDIPAGEWLFFPTNPRGDQAKIIFDDMNATELDRAAPNNPIIMSVGMPERNINMASGNAIRELWRKYGDFLETYGRYWIDASGNPSGILEAPASRIPWEDEEFGLGPKPEDVGPHFRKILIENFSSMGVTTLSAGLNTWTVRAYQWLDSQGQMPLRYAYGAMAAFGPGVDLNQFKLGDGTDNVFIASMSPRAVDGAGGRMCIALPRDAQAAASAEGPPSARGMMAISSGAPWFPRGQCSLDIEYNGGTRGARIQGNYFLEWYSQIAATGLRAGNFHISGDDSHSRFISHLERIDQADPGAVKGWAMDHCNLIDPRDVIRAGKLGLMWSCNPSAATSQSVAAAFGEQVLTTHAVPVRSMIDAGINVSLEGEGSGTFWGALETLITRKDEDGKVWWPAQRVDRVLALRIATQNGANYVAKGDLLGSIEPDKFADLVILDRDYMAMPEEEIGEMRPLMTMKGGQFIFLRTDFANEYNLHPVGAEISTHEDLQARRPQR